MKKLSKLTLHQMPLTLQVLIIAIVLAIALAGIWLVFNVASFAP